MAEEKINVTNESEAAAEKPSAEEEIKQYLISTDFTEEGYEKLNFQQLIVLKNSAMLTMKKADKQFKDFFSKREEFFLNLIMRRLSKMDTIYCAFSPLTKVPYIHKDEQTNKDQVWVYSHEAIAKASVERMKAQKRNLGVVKVDNKDFLSFFGTLVAMGIKEILIEQPVNPMPIPLDKLITQPDYSKVPEQQRPVMNPELVLTAIYFAQEQMSPDADKNIRTLKKLENELFINIKRGKLIVPALKAEGFGKANAEEVKIPQIKLPNGDIYQPICTDMSEFNKYNLEGKMRPMVIAGSGLAKAVNANVKGFVLNPATIKILIPKEKI